MALNVTLSPSTATQHIQRRMQPQAQTQNQHQTPSQHRSSNRIPCDHHPASYLSSQPSLLSSPTHGSPSAPFSSNLTPAWPPLSAPLLLSPTSHCPPSRSPPISCSYHRTSTTNSTHSSPSPSPSPSPSSSSSPSRSFTAVLIVPTGVGAAIGGFAGDAIPVARGMAEVADCLITHPNVLNGAMLYWPLSNALYVEGCALDRFAAGSLGLRPVHQNRVGLVLDSGIEEDLIQRHLQVADGCRASLGLPIAAYCLTDTPLKVHKWVDEQTGQSTGRLEGVDSLLRAVEGMVREEAVDAVAVVTRFPDDDPEEINEYRHGEGVDALSGVEAIISHLIVDHFNLPAAHAPALAPLPLLPSISPRSAAEELGFTFLPCVLAGLSRAPQLLPLPSSPPLHRKPSESRQGWSAQIWADDVDCVVLPADAFGGGAALAFGRAAREGRHEPLMIAVGENETVMRDTPESLGINAIHVKNYWEALGVMAAYKAGVNPRALRRDAIQHIKRCNVNPDTAMHSSGTPVPLVARS